MTHRLVARRREGDKVRPKTLLNLGRTFSIAKEDWRLVCQRVDELMTHQTTLNFMTLPAEIEMSKGLWRGGLANACWSARSTDRRPRTGRGSMSSPSRTAMRALS